jgi:L-tartrate/succinate antiporter
VQVGLPLVVGAGIALAPAPDGLTANAWLYFALFTAVMLAVITEPIPIAAVGLVGIVAAAVSGLVRESPAQATAWALSGFADRTVWLVFAACLFAVGYGKTGLGRRIALLLIRAMGHRTLGLGYATALADLSLAPFMPSNTARSGGTIYPILANIPGLYGSQPNDPSARKIGSYVIYNALAVTCVTSSMFATALAPNVMALGIVSATIGVNIAWMDWFRAAAPVGILLLAVVPFLLYKIYPPEIKESPDAPRWAGDELRRMGPITRREKTLLALVTMALALWIGADRYIDATMVALLVVALMLLLGVVTWKDALSDGPAWNILIWLATLVTMANGLAEVGFVKWLAETLAPSFAGHSVAVSMTLLVGSFFFLHYLFAGVTSHVSALLPVFLGVAVQLPGATHLGWAMLLCLPLGLMGIITPYGTGPSPVYYDCGYIPGKDFWRLGLVLGLLYFVAYIAIGVPWLRWLEM